MTHITRRPIAHYENRYELINDGTVINLANNEPLQWIKNPNGYFKISLANGDGTATQKLVHILVAEHFVPNPYKYPQVNHTKGDKKDNRFFMLEWCTAQQNIIHAFKTGLRPGYMSANDKELYLQDILSGKQVNDLAAEINRHPNSLHKMLRDTAKRIGLFEEWQLVMKENRSRAAIRNLEKNNFNRT